MNGNHTCLLAAISPSPASLETLLTASTLARSSGAELVLLQSLQLNICGEERGIDRQGILRDLMLDAETRLTQWARSICRNLPFSIIIREGPPADAILRTAEDCRANAIVIGSRRQGIKSWFRRNNVRAVLRDAKIPIYAVVSHDEPEAFINTRPRPRPTASPAPSIQILRGARPSVTASA